MITKEILTVPSSDGIHTLSGVVYVPDGTPKGIFHVVHGMIEHIGRYEQFMIKVAEHGYVCFGYDNLGHGKTVTDENELGFIAENKGWEYICKDIEEFRKAVSARFGTDIPYILMGHSMGSFIVRVAAGKSFVSPDKLIVMGTGGPNPASYIGLLFIRLMKLFKGGHGYSGFIENLAFGAYNAHFKDEKDNKSWLTKDISERDKNRNDPLCNFSFTLSAFEDLLTLNNAANSKKWFNEYDKKLPTLFVSGMDDPVGDYGKGTETVFERLNCKGCNVRIKLYENCRHEILNDSDRDLVTADILDFCNN